MNGSFGIGWRVQGFRLELGFWGRGESKKPTLCVRIASAEKAFNLNVFRLCHSVAMVTQKNSSSSLPCQPYSLLFNAFRPCWTPALQYEYVQALHRKHKALDFSITPAYVQTHTSIPPHFSVMLNYHVFMSQVEEILSRNIHLFFFLKALEVSCSILKVIKL